MLTQTCQFAILGESGNSWHKGYKRMNVNIGKVAQLGVNSFGQNEDKNARARRMRAYWADSKNAVLHPIGRFLASVIDNDGTTLADLVVKGETVTIDSVTLATGEVLPVVPAARISLQTTATVWGCPACRSAHGSGVYPSRTKDIDAANLAHNKWFYNPATRQIHVISDTCWGTYVKAMGAITDARFKAPVIVPQVDPLPDTPEAPTPTPSSGGRRR